MSVISHFLLSVQLGVQGIRAWCIFGVTLGSFEKHMMDYKGGLCCFVAEQNLPAIFAFAVEKVQLLCINSWTNLEQGLLCYRGMLPHPPGVNRILSWCTEGPSIQSSSWACSLQERCPDWGILCGQSALWLECHFICLGGTQSATLRSTAQMIPEVSAAVCSVFLGLFQLFLGQSDP